MKSLILQIYLIKETTVRATVANWFTCGIASLLQKYWTLDKNVMNLKLPPIIPFIKAMELDKPSKCKQVPKPERCTNDLVQPDPLVTMLHKPTMSLIQVTFLTTLFTTFSVRDTNSMTWNPGSWCLMVGLSVVTMHHCSPPAPNSTCNSLPNFTMNCGQGHPQHIIGLPCQLLCQDTHASAWPSLHRIEGWIEVVVAWMIGDVTHCDHR